MTALWTLFRSETRRYFAVQWSRLGDTLSWYLYFFMMLIAAVILIGSVRGGEFGKGASLLLAAGWLTWMVASDCMGELPYALAEEAQTGTLEQLCITPLPLSVILFVRSLAYFLGIGARGLVGALVLSLFIAPLSLSPVILVLFFISLVGAYGLGFLFAGLALIFKRIQSVTSLVFSLMIFFTGSLVGLESTGLAFQFLKIMFPLTWGISLMRQVLSGALTVSTLFSRGDLLELAVHSVVYLLVGYTFFTWCYAYARRKGTLGHY